MLNYRPNLCHYCRGAADECVQLPDGEFYSCEACRTALLLPTQPL